MIKENPYRQASPVAVAQEDESVLICADLYRAGQLSAEKKQQKQTGHRGSAMNSGHPAADGRSGNASRIPGQSGMSVAKSEIEAEEADPATMLVMPRHNFSQHESDNRLWCIGVLVAMISVALFLI